MLSHARQQTSFHKLLHWYLKGDEQITKTNMHLSYLVNIDRITHNIQPVYGVYFPLLWHNR